MNTISEITKDCEREDCAISFQGGVSTCVAWTPTYDKQGNRIDKGDPNSHSQTAICSTCRGRWHLSTRYGETTITVERQPQNGPGT